MGAIALGLVPALGWGLQSIVMQKVGGTFANKQMGLVLAALLFGVVSLALHPVALTPQVAAAGILSGAPWAIAQTLAIKSYDYLGVSRAMPVITALQLTFVSIAGAVLFGEWASVRAVALGVVAIALVAGGAALTAWQERPEGAKDAHRGIALLLLATVGYVAYAVAPRYFDVDGLAILFPQSAVMFVTSLVAALAVNATLRRRGGLRPGEGALGAKSWQNMSAVLCFAVANVTVIFSNQLNGVAMGWTLSMMNVIVASLGGIFLLHEEKTPRERRLLFAGVALVAAGCVVMGLTKL